MTTSILLICRANLCRSPAAEVLLSVALDADHVAGEVHSAGVEAVVGQVAPPPFVEAALSRGIDLRDRAPIAYVPEMGSRSDLVLTMTRDLLRTMVVNQPSLWPRSFTLLELVRRGVSLEPPEPSDTLAGWIGRVHASRDRSELLGANAIDDVRDPMAAAEEDAATMFEQLETATRRLSRLLAVLSG